MTGASKQLNAGGVMCVIQNNRNFDESDFLANFELLLESMNPGYSRYCRKFDFLREMIDSSEVSAKDVTLHTHD